MRKIVLEFTNDDLDGGRIAMNSIDAHDALQLYTDDLQQRAALSLDPSERSTYNTIARELRDKLQEWADQ